MFGIESTLLRYLDTRALPSSVKDLKSSRMVMPSHIIVTASLAPAA
jgi:hypothetical protein